MKKVILTVIAVCILAACATSGENPNVGPQLTVVIPELFSPDPEIVDDKMSVEITVNHPVRIKDWTIVIQPARLARQATQTAAAGQGEARQPRAEGQAEQPRRQRAPFFTQEGHGTPPTKWEWNGKSSRPSGEMVQSATDYRFELTVNDIFDNSSTFEGTIAVDVLVRREGNNLRIIVPSIIFPGDSSDLNRVSEEDQRANRRVIRLIATALTRYPDYRITIEGHANPLSAAGTPEWTRQENTLRPLSEQRARAVGDFLVTNHNITRNRFTYTGLGSTRPVADFTDEEELWKNRRVEFILIR
ncbi:MAG: OmpA family protein [Treponema sp.]|nr:OmpA family protein [Treponema sp.]MCL2236790.1 OmpA family protein [Treponema sp.]